MWSIAPRLREKAIATGRWVDRLSQRHALVLAYVILLAIALIDYLTEVQVSFNVFYLVPVLIVSWRNSTKAAWLVCFLSAVTWQTNFLLLGERDSGLWIYLWNFGTRLLLYLVISFLLQRTRRLMAELAIQSRTDSLTGLQNRRAFVQSLNDELLRQQRSNTPLSLAFVDLDHFKQVNDTQGHLVGDQVLKEVAILLRARLRRTDAIGRMGGDEFAILMPETDGEHAMTALREVRQNMLESMARQGLPITFSMGMVTGNSGATPEELLRQADALMYEVKREGRNDIRQREFMLS
jgi:diguanylate cyclase (GGDEF)-like protein